MPIFQTSVGVACIYAGYRLFCGLPAMKQPVSWRTVFLLNAVPGALLALFGTGILTVEARTVFPHARAIHQAQPATEGTSWHHAMPKLFDRAG